MESLFAVLEKQMSGDTFLCLILVILNHMYTVSDILDNDGDRLFQVFLRQPELRQLGTVPVNGMQ